MGWGDMSKVMDLVGGKYVFALLVIFACFTYGPILALIGTAAIVTVSLLLFGE